MEQKCWMVLLVQVNIYLIIVVDYIQIFKYQINICSNMIHSDQLTPDEIKLIQLNQQPTNDLDQLATIIVQKIKLHLNIDRSLSLIKSYLISASNKQPLGSNSPKQLQSSLKNNLFKTFQENKMSQLPLTSLARPVPKRKAQIPFVSKRKVAKREAVSERSSWNLQQRLDQIQQINQECTYSYDKYERKINKKTSIKQQSQGGISPNILWFYNEFFYSNYDKRYFQNLTSNQMKQIYNQLNLKPGQPELTLKTHKRILKSLPNVRIFNQQFILNQRNKLQQYRNQCRHNTKNLVKTSSQSTTDFPVHSFVLALHPLCGHLHTGSIMAYYKDNLFMVRFLKPELPAHKILDINMSTQFINMSNSSNPNKMVNRNQLNMEREKNNNVSNNNNNGNISLNQNSAYEVLQNINFDATGYLIKLLAFKSQLIKLMTAINDRCDKKQNVAPEKLDSNISFINHSIVNTNRSRQTFQWLVCLVKKLDLIIQQTLVRFRLRGVNQTNSPAIFNNLKSLLLNPLKLMSKEFENSNQQTDMNAAQQIRQIITKQRQNQIRKALNNAILQANMKKLANKQQNKKDGQMENEQNEKQDSNLQNNKNNNHSNGSKQNEGQKKVIQPKTMELIYSCLGILADLKYEGKEFDYRNNPYLIKLADISGKDYSQSFNQVYEKLYSIVSKVKE